MPSKKRKEFEALSLEVPFRSIYLSMFEVSEQYNSNIKTMLKYLDEGKTATTEITSNEVGAESTVIEVVRTSRDNFVVTNRATGTEEEYSPNEFLNWLYATAPFMVMVGYSNI